MEEREGEKKRKNGVIEKHQLYLKIILFLTTSEGNTEKLLSL